jgi:hypothetical protein
MTHTASTAGANKRMFIFTETATANVTIAGTHQLLRRKSIARYAKNMAQQSLKRRSTKIECNRFDITSATRR